jgi:hypothetical protein
MMRLGHRGEHRLAVDRHLGMLDDDVRPPSSIQNHSSTVGIDYICKDAHAIGILMVLANSDTRCGAYRPGDPGGSRLVSGSNAEIGDVRPGRGIRLVWLRRGRLEIGLRGNR